VSSGNAENQTLKQVDFRMAKEIGDFYPASKMWKVKMHYRVHCNTVSAQGHDVEHKKVINRPFQVTNLMHTSFIL